MWKLKFFLQNAFVLTKVTVLTLKSNVMSSDLSKFNSKNNSSDFKNETSLMTIEEYIATHSLSTSYDLAI